MKINISQLQHKVDVLEGSFVRRVNNNDLAVVQEVMQDKSLKIYNLESKGIELATEKEIELVAVGTEGIKKLQVTDLGLAKTDEFKMIHFKEQVDNLGTLALDEIVDVFLEVPEVKELPKDMYQLIGSPKFQVIIERVLPYSFIASPNFEDEEYRIDSQYYLVAHVIENSSRINNNVRVDKMNRDFAVMIEEAVEYITNKVEGISYIYGEGSITKVSKVIKKEQNKVEDYYNYKALVPFLVVDTGKIIDVMIDISKVANFVLELPDSNQLLIEFVEEIISQIDRA